MSEFNNQSFSVEDISIHEEEEEEEEADDIDLPVDISKQIALPTLSFSAEEAIAILLLRWTAQFKDFTVLRTDDPEVYVECGIRINLGEEYNHEEKTYINSKNLKIDDYPSSMTVAGLIFYHYGEEAIINHLETMNLTCPEGDRAFLLKRLYTAIIEPLDLSLDNLSIYSDVRKLAQIMDPIDDHDPIVKQENFESLIDIIIEQFDQRISWAAKKLLPGRNTIRKAIEDRKKILPSGDIVVIPHYVPLTMNKDLIEKKSQKKHGIKYIAMPRAVGDGGVYALRWNSNFRKLKFNGFRDEHLTGMLQNFNGTGWIHPNGLVGAMDKLPNAVEYLKQILKDNKAGIASNF